MGLRIFNFCAILVSGQVNTGRGSAMSDTFGERVRELRLKNTEYSLREFARLLGLSASYISDVENNRRKPPNEQRIIQIAKLLNADINQLLALAEKTPSDFYKTFTKSEVYTKKVPEFLRRAREQDLTEDQWNRLIKRLDQLDDEEDV